MEVLKVIILLLGIIKFSKSQEECIVRDQKFQRNIPCSFPFIFDGKIYYGCTTNLVETKKFACSTKTTSSSEHIEGEFISYKIEKQA